MSTTQTFGAAEFKSRCLDILERLDKGEIERVVVTKRGKPVAVLTPSGDNSDADLPPLYGCMRGSVSVPPDVDLTEPVLSEIFEASVGNLHG